MSHAVGPELELSKKPSTGAFQAWSVADETGASWDSSLSFRSMVEKVEMDTKLLPALLLLLHGSSQKESKTVHKWSQLRTLARPSDLSTGARAQRQVCSSGMFAVAQFFKMNEDHGENWAPQCKMAGLVWKVPDASSTVHHGAPGKPLFAQASGLLCVPSQPAVSGTPSILVR